MKTLLYYLILLTVLQSLMLGCRKRKTGDSDVKYVPSQKDVRYEQVGHHLNSYLINKIGEPIKVFIEAKECDFPDDPHLKIAEDAATRKFVEDGIYEWLDSLRLAEKIGLVEFDVPITNEVIASHVYSEVLFAPLKVRFLCQFGRSNFRVFGEEGESTPLITLMVGKKDSYKQPVEFLHNLFSMGTYLHELGHAFGLSDTYIVDNVESPHNVSITDNPKRFGNQPTSLMNDSYDVPYIGRDEIYGLAHLYRMYIKRDLTANECLEGYVHETETGGCKPAAWPTPFTSEYSACAQKTSRFTTCENRFWSGVEIALQCLEPHSIGANLYQTCLAEHQGEDETPLTWCFENAYARHLLNRPWIPGGFKKNIYHNDDNEFAFTKEGRELVLTHQFPAGNNISKECSASN